jgi:hypothetical protein
MGFKDLPKVASPAGNDSGGSLFSRLFKKK